MAQRSALGHFRVMSTAAQTAEAIFADLPAMLTVKHLQQCLQISRTTIYLHARDGKFPMGTKIGCSVRWPKQAMISFMARKLEAAGCQDSPQGAA